MSGDRWVVRYPTGEWGVERSSRRTSSELFLSMEDALVVAREQAAAAGGGDVAVQLPDGRLSLREQVFSEHEPLRAQRQPQDAAASALVAWTVFA